MTIKLIQGVVRPREASSFIRSSITIIGLFSGLLLSGSINAASACKGLDNTACGASASCGWVESYQRKDGRTVKAFCRTKSVSKAKASEASSKASSKAALKSSNAKS